MPPTQGALTLSVAYMGQQMKSRGSADGMQGFPGLRSATTLARMTLEVLTCIVNTPPS